MKAFANQKYTLDEYFDLERNSEEKWEYWDGDVWCMSGASLVHEDIVSNTLHALRSRLPAGCKTSASNVRVKVPNYPPYRYPDITIVCGKREQETVSGLELLLNPQVIIEVLSPSTEAFDRGAKFTYYKSIPSLREYVMIATEDPYVTQLVKKSDDEWSIQDNRGLDAVLLLRTFDVEIPLTAIYFEVDFPPRGFIHPEIERSFR